MTDPLGQSQVLAYLIPLAAKGYTITILSFEKRGAFAQLGDEIQSRLTDAGITWHPLMYHKSPPILSTLYDIRKGWNIIVRLLRQGNIDVIHCRGYIAAVLGRKAQKKYGIHWIFDMRGWWPDEKKEGGYWRAWYYQPVYRYFKRLEAEFIKKSTVTVSLTQAGKDFIIQQDWKKETAIPVIPTCVDMEQFPPFSEDIRAATRQQLGIPEEAFVVLYSGSLGGNYRTDLVVFFLQAMQQKHPNAHLLVISRSDEQLLWQEVDGAGVARDQVVIVSASYNKVHKYLMAGDVGVIFYAQGFSTIGRSPTKLGEYWACGLPAASIPGMGDLDSLAAQYPLGIQILHEQQWDGFQWDRNREILREFAQEYYSLASGINVYAGLFASI